MTHYYDPDYGYIIVADEAEYAGLLAAADARLAHQAECETFALQLLRIADLIDSGLTMAEALAAEKSG